MTKITSLLVFLLSFGISELAAQKKYNNEVKINDSARAIFEYSYAHKFDTTNLNRIFKEEMLLVVTSDASYFTPLKKYIQDSIDLYNSLHSAPVNSSMIDTRNRKTSVLPELIKLNNNNLTVFTIYNNYGVSDTVNFNWELLNETKVYNGIKLNKATTFFRGRKYEAWYAPEIAINNGPWKFRGLPGLIMFIHDLSNDVDFSFKGVYSKVNTTVKKEIKYQTVSRKQMNTIINTFISDPIGFFTAQTGISDMTIEGFQPVKTDKPKITIINPNNPIELFK